MRPPSSPAKPPRTKPHQPTPAANPADQTPPTKPHCPQHSRPFHFAAKRPNNHAEGHPSNRPKLHRSQRIPRPDHPNRQPPPPIALSTDNHLGLTATPDRQPSRRESRSSWITAPEREPPRRDSHFGGERLRRDSHSRTDIHPGGTVVPTDNHSGRYPHPAITEARVDSESPWTTTPGNRWVGNRSTAKLLCSVSSSTSMCSMRSSWLPGAWPPSCVTAFMTSTPTAHRRCRCGRPQYRGGRRSTLSRGSKTHGVPTSCGTYWIIVCGPRRTLPTWPRPTQIHAQGPTRPGPKPEPGARPRLRAEPGLGPEPTQTHGQTHDQTHDQGHGQG